MTLESPLARRDVILGRLAQGQSVAAVALALEFEVSEDAIRRDLRALAAEGRCRRVYGGALPLSKATAPMAARMEEARDRKQALARRAVSVVEPGQFVFLDSGSTNLALVSCLPEAFELTIATSPPPPCGGPICASSWSAARSITASAAAWTRQRR
jgi:DeoR/GlpR family transcriptional regulator of sugar metabolism